MEDIKECFEEVYSEITDTVEKIRDKIHNVIGSDSEKSKNFRNMIYEKELSQLLSGYSQLQKIRIDILKELNKMNTSNEEDTNNLLFKLLEQGNFGDEQELENIQEIQENTQEDT